jgi:hypothetical protein
MVLAVANKDPAAISDDDTDRSDSYGGWHAIGTDVFNAVEGESVVVDGRHDLRSFGCAVDGSGYGAGEVCQDAGLIWKVEGDPSVVRICGPGNLAGGELRGVRVVGEGDLDRLWLDAMGLELEHGLGFLGSLDDIKLAQRFLKVSNSAVLRRKVLAHDLCM